MYRITLSIFLLMMTGNRDGLSVALLKSAIVEGIPGASGIVYAAGKIYVIGDNAPFLLRLDEKFRVISKIFVYSLSNL